MADSDCETAARMEWKEGNHPDSRACTAMRTQSAAEHHRVEKVRVRCDDSARKLDRFQDVEIEGRVVVL